VCVRLESLTYGPGWRPERRCLREAFTLDDDVGARRHAAEFPCRFGFLHRAGFDTVKQFDGFFAAGTDTADFATSFGSRHRSLIGFKGKRGKARTDRLCTCRRIIARLTSCERGRLNESTEDVLLYPSFLRRMPSAFNLASSMKTFFRTPLSPHAGAQQAGAHQAGAHHFGRSLIAWVALGFVPLAPLFSTNAQAVEVAAGNEAAETAPTRDLPPGSESLITPDLADAWTGAIADWRVEEGTLIGTADGSLKQNRFLVSKIAPVEDFEMKVDVWISGRGNSGLQYRSVVLDDVGPDVMTGYQCDVVAAVPKYNGMLYEERGRRILCHTGESVITDKTGQGWVLPDASSPPPVFAPEQWHQYRVIVRGNHHQHWIDDQLTADHLDLDPVGRRLSGKIGVQVHVGPAMEVRYRNFFITRLTPTTPPGEEAAIPSDAVEIVPQGGGKKKPR